MEFYSHRFQHCLFKTLGTGKRGTNNLRRQRNRWKSIYEQDAIKKKLIAIEKKIIVGGENLLEKAEEQEKMLEESAKELEETIATEQKLREKLEAKEYCRLAGKEFS